MGNRFLEKQRAFYKALKVRTQFSKWNKENDMSNSTFITLWNLFSEIDPKFCDLYLPETGNGNSDKKGSNLSYLDRVAK